MTVETLVTIHDQALVDACEAEGRFVDLRPYRYLFVGPRPAIDAGEDVIVARDWSSNVEHWPEFYDFTGWWTVAHHGMLRASRVVCLQYDHQVPAPFLPAVDELLERHPMVAFVAGHRSAGNFMLQIPGFDDAYRVGLAACGASPMETWPDFEEWPSTQGTAWRHAAFYWFMQWVRPAFDVWAGHLWAGHLMERMVKAWLVTTGQTEGYLHGAVVHEGRDCHGTCALMAGRADVHAERAATFGR